MSMLMPLRKGFIWRQRRSFSVRLLAAALILAVASVVSIVAISAMLQSSLMSASGNFLAADRLLKSPREIDSSWLDKAQSYGLKTARTLEFTTMLRRLGAAGQNPQARSFHLVSVKALDGQYPLKGALETDQGVLTAGALPAQAGLWLHPRLFGALGIEQGAGLAIGEHSLSANARLLQEPDAGFSLAGLAPRVMMRLDEVAFTEVVQAGSRLNWTYYFVGSTEALSKFEQWLKPKLVASQKWQGIEEGRPAISEALDKADNYLLLGGSLAVLLAALAVAMASRQFVLEQTDIVAITKTLGAKASAIWRQYCVELLLLALLAFALGAVLGVVLSEAWWAVMVTQSEYFNSRSEFVLPIKGLAMAAFTILLMLLCFALPVLWHLRATPAMRVLRQAGAVSLRAGRASAALALFGAALLLFVYAQSWVLVLGLVGVLLVLVLLLFSLNYLVLNRMLVPLSSRLSLGSPLRLALQSLHRNRTQSALLLAVFSIAVYLFSSLLLLRTSLLDQWQQQLPVDAPNHFLINAAQRDLTDIEAMMSAADVRSSGLYPMVRGRLSHINGEAVKTVVSKDVGALNRELNLTWSANLPEDNRILAGQWWSSADANELAAVSVESELAGKLGLELGDELRFQIGGRRLDVEILSIRSVQWDSMRPNFYMMFPAGVLADFPATYITSFYLPAESKGFLNELALRFPSVSVLELDQLITKIRAIVGQVSIMIELLLGFIFVAALLVLAGLVASTRNERVAQAVMLRTFGASGRVIKRVQFWEFALMGAISALVGVLAAECSVHLLRLGLFDDSQVVLQYRFWLLVTVATTAIVSLFAYAQTRSIPKVSPVAILRQA